MTVKNIKGTDVELDDIGYMTKLEQWSKDIARELAKSVDIHELTDRHWTVIDYIQAEYKKGTALSIRRINKSGVVDVKEFFELFPDGPLKKASLIAGIPKPISCV